MSSITGFDVGEFIDESIRWIATAKESKPQIARLVEAKKRCPSETLMCTQGLNDDLAENFLIASAQAAAALTGVSYAFGGIGPPITAAGVGFSLVAVPMISVARTYSINYACLVRFPPLLPVCLFDDIYDLIDKSVLPRHINWPRGLSADGFTRVNSSTSVMYKKKPRRIQRLTSSPLDCSALGFEDGFAVGLFWLQYSYGNSWRPYAPLSLLQLFLGEAQSNAYIMRWVGRDLDPLVDCGKFHLVQVPLALVIVGVVAIAFFALIQLFAVVALKGVVLIGDIVEQDAKPKKD